MEIRYSTLTIISSILIVLDIITPIFNFELTLDNFVTLPLEPYSYYLSRQLLF
jgi:hypothetical protein